MKKHSLTEITVDIYMIMLKIKLRQSKPSKFDGFTSFKAFYITKWKNCQVIVMCMLKPSEFLSNILQLISRSQTFEKMSPPCLDFSTKVFLGPVQIHRHWIHTQVFEKHSIVVITCFPFLPQNFKFLDGTYSATSQLRHHSGPKINVVKQRCRFSKVFKMADKSASRDFCRIIEHRPIEVQTK